MQLPKFIVRSLSGVDELSVEVFSLKGSLLCHGTSLQFIICKEVKFPYVNKAVGTAVVAANAALKVLAVAAAA